MGNTTEKPSGIVQVSTYQEKNETVAIDLPPSEKSENSLIFQSSSIVDHNIKKFFNYYIPLHRYRAGAMLKDQENIMKKSESIEVKCNKALLENFQKLSTLSSKLHKSQLKLEIDLLKVSIKEINEDLLKIREVLNRVNELV